MTILFGLPFISMGRVLWTFTIIVKWPINELLLLRPFRPNLVSSQTLTSLVWQTTNRHYRQQSCYNALWMDIFSQTPTVIQVHWGGKYLVTRGEQYITSVHLVLNNRSPSKHLHLTNRVTKFRSSFISTQYKTCQKALVNCKQRRRINQAFWSPSSSTHLCRERDTTINHSTQQQKPSTELLVFLQNTTCAQTLNVQRINSRNLCATVHESLQ